MHLHWWDYCRKQETEEEHGQEILLVEITMTINKTFGERPIITTL